VDPELVTPRSQSHTLSPRRSLVVVPVVQVVATPLGVQVPVVPLGLMVPLTGIMEADDHYGMMTIHRGMEVEIRLGVEVEGGVEAIPPPLVVLPPRRSLLLLNLLSILVARLHMPSLSIPPSPRRSLVVQATLVVATLGVLVAGVMMDGMVVIGVVVIAGNLVHITITMIILRKATRLSVRRFLLLLLLVLPDMGRRRYVNLCLLYVENVSSSFSHHLTTPLSNFNSSTSPEMQGWNVPIPT